MTLLIANNCTRDNGQFMGDQLCYVKVAYMMAASQPLGTKILMSMSPSNEMHFVWQKFLDTFAVEVIWDDFHPGDNTARWETWDKWRAERCINDTPFDDYRELYLRIHGAQRQQVLCGSERGFGRKNIFEYVYYGQENKPETCEGSDWYDDRLFTHPVLLATRDVYISPHCKTQGNLVFTFDFWSDVVRRLLAAGVTVTVGYDGYFCPELDSHPLFKRHWGSHEEWFNQVCSHKLVTCGNTATGWVAAACGVPLITMEPYNSCMADHRYRECGLRNLVEVVDGFVLDSMDNDMGRVAEYVAQRICAEVRSTVVLTTGCYDVLHAGHVRHLERSRALGTKLIVALNSDASVQELKGPSRPINPYTQRKVVLEALRSVDEVHLFDGDSEKLIREMRPDVLACGFGYTPESIKGRELVVKAVVTCTGDASNEPSTTKIVKRVQTASIVEVCRLGAAVSINPMSKLMLLAEHLLSVSDIAGDLADVGAYKGGTSLIMRRLAPEKHLHLFDTWAGNPIDDPLCHHKKGEWPASIIDCKQLVGHDRVAYWRGVFPFDFVQPIPLGLQCQQFSFIYVDPDTYQTVRDAIEFFWPRIVKGGKMFFDDYGWEPCAGVKKAVDELLNDVEKIVYEKQYSCVVVKA